MYNQELFEEKVVKKLANEFVMQAITAGVPNEIVKNIEVFFKTRFVRYCILLAHSSGGDGTEGIPCLDFRKKWTDEELFADAGFTDEEIAEVYRIML